MDIHKPKPWRSVREFLKEYVIIVVGVLTALGAEQAVERFHENRISAEARQSVREEIDLNLSSLRQRDSYLHCINERFEEIDRALAAAEHGHPFPMLAYIGRPMVPAVYRQRWDAATSGGRTSLLSSGEQRDFARVYWDFDRFFEHGNGETAAWAKLRVLEGVERPSAETIALARQALAEAKSEDYTLRHIVRGARFYAAQLGVKGEAPMLMATKNRAEGVCLPTSTSPQAAAVLTGDPERARPGRREA